MPEHRDHKDKEVMNVPQKRGQKPYMKPRLIEYGHMEKLTQGATGKGLDAGGKLFR